MDDEITLVENVQWIGTETELAATAAATQPPKMHRFLFYGQTSRDNAAAFAAAKVFLESAIDTAARESGGRVGKADPKASNDGRHYFVFVWFPPKGLIAGRGLGLSPDVSDAEESHSKFEVTVHLAPKQIGNLVAAVGYDGRSGHSIFSFTAVNLSVIRCIRALSGESAMMHRSLHATTP